MLTLYNSDDDHLSSVLEIQLLQVKKAIETMSLPLKKSSFMHSDVLVEKQEITLQSSHDHHIEWG